MSRPSGIRVRRLYVRLSESMLVVPAICVVLALALSWGMMYWDRVAPLTLLSSISPGSAGAALSALASGMLAFTGFVTSVVLLIVQFGTSEFGPRLLRWFRRDRTLKYALSAFIATFLFALVSTAQVGSGPKAVVPSRTLLTALALTLLSVIMFLVLVDRTSNGLRVASVVQSVDGAAREVFDAVYPPTASVASAAQEAASSLNSSTPVQTLHHKDVGAVIMTLDRAGLAALAERKGAVIEMVHAVGDHIPTGGTVLNVHGASPLPLRKMRRAIVMGDERTIDDDPAFAIRMLVDVAIKALSPAVNDPTTAVQSLDRIEDLLRYAADKHLSVGIVADTAGTIRLIYPTPTWDDLVELALAEIRAFGAGQYQIARRLRALLDSLLEDVPERRRPALHEQKVLLEDAVDSAFPESQRREALVADRQGIGMSGRASDRLG
jgi:uncharacterized membrane protein